MPIFRLLFGENILKIKTRPLLIQLCKMKSTIFLQNKILGSAVVGHPAHFSAFALAFDRGREDTESRPVASLSHCALHRSDLNQDDVDQVRGRLHYLVIHFSQRPQSPALLSQALHLLKHFLHLEQRASS
jgi:hypothetical protein